MPVYVGGDIDAAGIKWVASFPDNIHRGLPRAHSVIVLNEADTGRPAAILNSSLPSIVRTVSVSGLVMRRFLASGGRSGCGIRLGVIGWGPIGRHHVRMAAALFGDRIERIRIYDLRPVDLEDVPAEVRPKAAAAESWEEVYRESNVFITCTASESRYIDRRPPEGSLLLDVSLRDYCLEAIAGVRAIVVDDWEEVCRENTDIELLHRHNGLTRSNTLTLADVALRSGLDAFAPDEPVLFCPMGLAVFDIAAAVHYVKLAEVHGLGLKLD
jgi:ornithine cyclodeaminase